MDYSSCQSLCANDFYFIGRSKHSRQRGGKEHPYGMSLFLDFIALLQIFFVSLSSLVVLLKWKLNFVEFCTFSDEELERPETAEALLESALPSLDHQWMITCSQRSPSKMGAVIAFCFSSTTTPTGASLVRRRRIYSQGGQGRAGTISDLNSTLNITRTKTETPSLTFSSDAEQSITCQTIICTYFLAEGVLAEGTRHRLNTRSPA